MGQAFRIVPEGEGFFTVKDVPIFETHDTRGFDCDEVWMREAVQNFEKDKAAGYRPTVIIGHNQKGIEKESNGFLDNVVLRGKRLYADLVRIPRDLKDKLLKNAYPGRSVEVLPSSKRILALALLGGTTPFFSLPQMAYSNDERSIWYRSPTMADNNTNPHVDVQAIATAAAKEAVAQYQASQVAEAAEAAPQVYELTIPQGAEFLRNNPSTQVFQGEDGSFYAQADENTFYSIPQQLLRYGAGEEAAKAFTGLTRGQKIAVGVGAGAVGAGVLKAAHSGYHRKKEEMEGKAPRRGFFNAAAHNAIPGYAGGRQMASVYSQHGNQRFQIDDQTGVVYFGGQAIGEVAMYSDEDAPGALPPIPNQDPNLVIEESAVGPGTDEVGAMQQDPGEPNNPNVQPLDRAASDQYAADQSGIIQYVNQSTQLQQAEAYQLRQEVEQLKYANELLQFSKRGETYKKYLLDLKKEGAPVGDVDTTVDFMLSQNDDQIKKFMAVIEKAPRIQLGATKIESYAMPTENEAKEEFSRNRDQFTKLGVTEADLKYDRYVRVNTFTNERSNGQGQH